MSHAQTLVNKEQLANKIAKAAIGVCSCYHKVNRQQKETFTFRDGSKIVITNNRVEVL